MDVTLRTGMPADAEESGRICFEAFGAIARQAQLSYYVSQS
jgi:hypothetical protein